MIYFNNSNKTYKYTSVLKTSKNYSQKEFRKKNFFLNILTHKIYNYAKFLKKKLYHK